MATPPYVVSGTTIDTTWGNQVANSLTNVFASSAARASAVTSPTAGMVSYLSTNLATEGFYTYNSAGQWRQASWNQPWGIVSYASTSVASSTTSGTTELVLSTATAFTAVANRYYRLCWNGTSIGTADLDLFLLQIRLTNIAGASYANQKHTVQGGSFQTPFSLEFVTSSIAAGSTTLVGTAQRQAGTGTLGTLSGSLAQITVYDMGPSGAPS